jgi:hypothetical protein
MNLRAFFCCRAQVSDCWREHLFKSPYSFECINIGSVTHTHSTFFPLLITHLATRPMQYTTSLTAGATTLRYTRGPVEVKNMSIKFPFNATIPEPSYPPANTPNIARPLKTSGSAQHWYIYFQWPRLLRECRKCTHCHNIHRALQAKPISQHTLAYRVAHIYLQSKIPDPDTAIQSR